MTPRKLIAIFLSMVMLGVLAMWVAWYIDTMQSTKGIKRIESRETFVYEVSKDEQEHRDVLVICDEESMDKPSDKFVEWLGLEGVPIRIPGGQLALAKLNDVGWSAELKPVQRTSIELLKRISPKRIVLVAHTKCIYYDAVAAWQDHTSTVVEDESRDMLAAINLLREWFPNAEVIGYMAHEDGGQIKFKSIR
jgi:hypothetical protein